MNASEEFLDLITTAHIVAATLDVLKVKDPATAFTDVSNSKRQSLWTQSWGI